MAIGWIKLYRKIQECELWESEGEPFDRRSAWLDLLLLANHEDKQIIFKGKPLTVKCGQRITSLRKLAERWNWSTNRVKRYIELLEMLGMITRESDNNKTLLTLVNYGIYQGGRYTDEHTHEYTDEYTDGTLTNTQTDTKQEVKNDKRMIKKDKKKTFGEYQHVKLTEDEYERLCKDFGDSVAQKAITAVDQYCQETGKTYKDYNLTIRRWGIDAAKKEKEPAQNDALALLEQKLLKDGVV